MIGADWRTPLDEAWERIGFDRAHSGQPRSDAAARPARSHRSPPPTTCWRAPAGGPGHIFNLGHGILPIDAGRARAGARALRASADEDDLNGIRSGLAPVQREPNKVSGSRASMGVLLMAHGTPSSLDEMPEYLRLVRGGRPPSAELVAEMRHNYEAIGGRSPLTDLTHGAGRGAAATARRRRSGRRRHAQLDAVHHGRDRGARGGGRLTRHRHSAGAAVLHAERRQSTSTRRRARCRPASSSTRSSRSTRIRCCSTRSPSACAQARAARRRSHRLHRPQPAGARHRGRRLVRRPRSRPRRRRRRARRHQPLPLSPTRAPAAHPSRGSAPT